MKSKIIALLLALLLVFSFVSCGDRNSEDEGENGGNSENVEIIRPPQSSDGSIEMPIIPWEPD